MRYLPTVRGETLIPSFSLSSSAIRSSPQVGFSRAISLTSSRRFFGNAGRPLFRDFQVQNIRKALRCHFTNVCGFNDDQRAAPIKKPPECDHDEANRRGGSARSNLAFLEQRELFSKKEILGDESDPGTKEQTEERQQLRILQQVAGRTEFLRRTATSTAFWRCYVNRLRP